MAADLTPLERMALHPSGRVRIQTSKGWRWVTKLPAIDTATGRFAHPSHRTAKAFAAGEGGRLVSAETIRAIAKQGYRIEPVILPTQAMIDAMPPRQAGETEKAYQKRIRRDMATAEWNQIHDDAVVAQLARWDGERPVMNAGKWHRDGAPPGRMYLMGWSRKDGSFIQGETDAGQPGPHDDGHGDYGTLEMIEWDDENGALVIIADALRPVAAVLDGALGVVAGAFGIHDTDPAPPPKFTPPQGTPAMSMQIQRQTIRKGSTGLDVEAWQRIIGAHVDGVFGAGTQHLTEQWQEAHGLVGDGLVGAKSWAAAGEHAAPPALAPSGSGRYPGDAPACRAALRDANARWPDRKRRSDGIPGDLAHMFKPGPDGKLGTADDVPNNSDHNLGNAVDITHDPANGCDGNVVAVAATRDPRTQYVIWSGKIWNVDRAAEGWRKYSGKNGHYHHVHISVRVSRRHDDSPWPWAPAADSLYDG